ARASNVLPCVRSSRASAAQRPMPLSGRALCAVARSGSVGFRCGGQPALAFGERGREAFGNACTGALIGAGANGQRVQLCCFLQANEDVTAHPQGGELYFELPQERSPSSTRLGVRLELRRDVVPTN